MSFRHYLREWREFRGLRQEDLAQKVGAYPSIVSRYETGDRRLTLEMAYKLCQALDIDLSELLVPPETDPVQRLKDIVARYRA